MTKYILESGNLSHYPEKSRRYFKELLDGTGNEPKILWCFFGTEAEKREVRFHKYLELNKNYYPAGINPIHKNATEEDFVAQTAWADIVKIHGGDTLMTIDILSKFDLKICFENKIISGHSAGSYAVSKQYWSPGRRVNSEGFGILPIKFIAHFNSDFGSDDPRGPIDWQAAYDELAAYGDTSLPIHALEEGDFVVYNI